MTIPRFSLLALAALQLLGVSAASSPPAGPIPGLITDWSLSAPVRFSAIALERYPDASVQSKLPWTPAPADPAGLVDLARLRPPLAGVTARVYARTTLHAAQPETRAFAFDFFGALSLYLNGRLVFRGQRGALPSPGSAAEPRWQNTLSLPLVPGENEILLAATSVSGESQFAARDLDAVYQHPSLVQLWELHGVLRAPESVAFDTTRQLLYVSNYEGDCISQIGFDGKVISLAWATGLRRPTGLQLYRDRLYAVERTGIVEIDPTTGAVLRRRALPGAAFPNDLSFGPDGALYVTDTQTNLLHKLALSADTPPEVVPQDPAVAQANGLLAEPSRLLVGITKTSTIQAVDLATGRATPFLALDPGALMDGLVSDGRGGYLLSDYFGRIYHADAAGRVVLLLDRSGPRKFCADIGYLPAQGLLVVPSMFDHRLTAYRLTLDDLPPVDNPTR